MNLTEEQLRFLLDHSLDAILLTIPDGRILAANPAACSMFGRTEEDIIKVGREGLIDTTDPWLPIILEERARNGKAKGELNFKRKDGSIFPCEMSSSLFADSSGNILSSIIIRDISHYKAIQAALEDAKNKSEESERAKADLLLKLNEAQYTAKIGSWEWNFLNRSVWWSDELFHIFELPLSDFIPKEEHVFKYIHPDDLLLVRTEIDRTVEEKKELNIDFRTITELGNLRYCTSRARVEYDSNNVPVRIYGTMMDISDRKKTEENLMASEERFRSLFEHNLSVMLLVDPATGDIIDANHAAENFYGWTREQMIMMRTQDINTLGEGVMDFLEQARTHTGMHFEFSHRRADGSIREVEIFSNRIDLLGKEHIHSIIHDITDRKEAERKLELLNRAVEQSPVSVMITDKGGNLVYVNPMFTEITGYQLEEVIGKNPRILQSRAYPEDFFKDLWDSILAGKVWRGEFLNKKKSGELYWEKSIITSIVNSMGEISYFIAVQEDITVMKKLGLELIQAKEKAEESDALKTAFLHNMSHEIRTPINAIVGFSEFLSDEQLDNEKRAKFVSIIIESSNQLLNIINDVMSMASIEAGQEQVIEKDISINTILVHMRQQYQHKAQHKSLEFRFFSPLNEAQATIRVDDNKLTQVLSCLINNAIKFTQAGFVSVGYTLKGNFIEFYVKDSGIGISPDLHDKIFHRFRQADNSHTRKYGGSGLGLAIADAYVKLLGGRIWLDSVPGQGSEFYFTIPYKKTIEENSNAHDHSLAFPANRKSVLIAEDEEFNFLLLEEVLLSLNVELTWAEDGQIAVDLCNSGKKFDLILMDLKMPRLNGVEAIVQIRQVYPDVPIIVQTAYDASFERQKAFECGCDDFITKPFSKIELLDKVQRFLKD
ncbi:MAG TPA: PAS domain S-box protein [Bacteroidales bacterium]|nr:PAS domain S-box protein [Bacteroidales bacterium]